MKTSEEISTLRDRCLILEKSLANLGIEVRNNKLYLLEKVEFSITKHDKELFSVNILQSALAVIAQYKTKDSVAYFSRECTVEQMPVVAGNSIIQPMVLKSGGVLIPVPNEHLQYISPCQQQP